MVLGRQLGTTLAATAQEHSAASAGLRALKEAVGAATLALFGLVGSLGAHR